MRRADLTYDVLEVVARVLFGAAGWTLHIRGIEHLPADGPVILASNHVSHLDPLYLGVAVRHRRRHLTFLAKREMFESPWTGWLLRLAEQIEVERGSHSSRPVEEAVEVLRCGGAVVVFPEGTISRSFLPAEPKPGLALMGLDSGAPIVPLACFGGQRLLTKDHANLTRRGVPLMVNIGPQLRPAAADSASALLDRVWAEVRTLVDEAIRAYPERPASGEDWWWPARLGGSAPTPEEARRIMDAEIAARRRRAQRVQATS